MDEEKGKRKNRWDDDDTAKAAKEEKRRRKEKHKEKEAHRRQAAATEERAAKEATTTQSDMVLLSASDAPKLTAFKTVQDYKRLNLIEEGSYGIVYRAENLQTGEIVALKKLKFDEMGPGFPITSLREINTLKCLDHPNILGCREVVVGDTHRDVYIVMDFIEHDVKTLMDHMDKPFLQSEVKTLMLQLLSAAAEMHDKWIIHRDLKTQNLLMTNRGIMKIADFGLATSFGDDEVDLTKLVVTLWYRAPELLLSSRIYDSAIDMWSIGCIFAELLSHRPFLRGKSELDQLYLIYKHVGVPSDETWLDYKFLPLAKPAQLPSKPAIPLKDQFPSATPMALDLLDQLLTLDPKRRITARQALSHPYFEESPPPKNPDFFPSFPSKGGLEHRRRV